MNKEEMKYFKRKLSIEEIQNALKIANKNEAMATEPKAKEQAAKLREVFEQMALRLGVEPDGTHTHVLGSWHEKKYTEGIDPRHEWEYWTQRKCKFCDYTERNVMTADKLKSDSNLK